MHFRSRDEMPMTPSLVFLIVGNLLDGILTLILLQFHGGDELNPLFAHLSVASPVAFMVTKLVMVNACIVFLLAVPDRLLLKVLTFRCCALLYGAVLAYQSWLFLGTFR